MLSIAFWAKCYSSIIHIIRGWRWKQIREKFLASSLEIASLRKEAIQRSQAPNRLLWKSFHHTVPDLVDFLVDELKLDASCLITRRISIEILSWTWAKLICNARAWDAALLQTSLTKTNWNLGVLTLDRILFQ